MTLHPTRGFWLAASAGLSLLAAGCGATGSRATATGNTALTATEPVTPLSTSLTTTAGAWATLPMTNPSLTPGTFWQLLYRPPGSQAAWTDHVDATATATNGGIVLAAAQPTVAAAVLPSDKLRFSPIVATATAGRSWTNGLLPAGVARRPDSLAIATTGQAAALVGTGARTRVVVAAHGLLTWSNLATTAQLAASRSGRSCGIDQLLAVTIQGATPLVGVSCHHPGVAGILAYRNGSWLPAGPVMPPQARSARVEVLSLDLRGSTLDALLELDGPSGTSLVTARQSAGQSRWTLSDPLTLHAPTDLRSYGPDGTGIYVLTDDPRDTGHPAMQLAVSTSHAWRHLQPPPPGTATVAFPSGAPPQALAPHDQTLAISTLNAAGTWRPTQHLQIPVGGS